MKIQEQYKVINSMLSAIRDGKCISCEYYGTLYDEVKTSLITAGYKIEPIYNMKDGSFVRILF